MNNILYMSVTDEGRRSIDSSFLDEKVAETESFWQDLIESGRVEHQQNRIVIRPLASDIEDFTEITGDDNFAHVIGLEPVRSKELADMLEESTSYTEPVVPEGYESAGEYRPLQQGALTPTAIAYDPHLGFDGLLTNLELSFIEPVFAGLSPGSADSTAIEKDGRGYDIEATNPWKEEDYVPTEVDYETVGEGDFTDENRRRVAILNALVARAPLENDQSLRDGDIFHSTEVDYPVRVLDGSDFAYRAEGSQEIAETGLGPLKGFHAEDDLDAGKLSYSETYIDADV